MLGRIKWYNLDKGYGFITGEDNREFFLHYSNILESDCVFFIENEEVIFDIEENDGKLIATNIKGMNNNRLTDFYFTVDKVFKVKNRGVVVEGICESGEIKVGDSILSSQNGIVKVLGIVQEKNLIDKISIPGRYGILLNCEDDSFLGEGTHLFSFEITEKEPELTGEDYYYLGIDYGFGSDELEKDVFEAVRLFEKALEKGYLEAYYQLGLLYYFNDELENNMDNSLIKLHEGVLNGIDDCYGELGSIYNYLDDVENAYLSYEMFFRGSNFFLDLYHPGIYKEYLNFCNNYSLEIDQFKINIMNSKKNEILEISIPMSVKSKQEYQQAVEFLNYLLKTLGKPDNPQTLKKIVSFINNGYQN